MTTDTSHLTDHTATERVTTPPELSGVLMVLFLLVALGVIALLSV